MDRSPPVSDPQTASDYQRFLQLLDEPGGDLSATAPGLKDSFIDEIAKWKAVEDKRLAAEPLSDTRIDALRIALKDTLNTGKRLACAIPCAAHVPEGADASRPILGMNFRTPRHFLVDEIFNQTYADPRVLGRMIARGVSEGEEHRMVGLLRSLQHERLQPSALAIREQIEILGDQAEYYVLLTPYGGLVDVDGWYSPEFSHALTSVIHIETSALDEEAILFDSRETLISCRKPEEKEGLEPVVDTSIALGVFDDVRDTDRPQVRVEIGEYFVVWSGDAPRVFRFGVGSAASGGADSS